MSNMAACVLYPITAFSHINASVRWQKLRLLHGHNFDQFKLRKLEEGKKMGSSIIVIIISMIISLLKIIAVL